MVDFGGTVTSITSGAREVGYLGVGIIAWFGIVIIVAAIIGIVLFLYLRNKKYCNKIIVWKKIGGQFKPWIRDKAKEVKHGKDGTTVFYLKKLKKIIPTPSLQVEDNTYYFFQRSDGEWINFIPEDFDELSKKMGAHFLDKEMRHVRLAIESNLSHRLEKKGNWLAENWTIIAGIGFVTMIGVMTFLLFDKWLELAAATNAGVDSAKLVLDEVARILGAMDNICSGGSGTIQLS